MMKRNRHTRTEWVSASDIGRAAFCPFYLVHKYKNSPVSKKATEARNYGEMGHQQLNAVAARDSRCFVASQVYGYFDDRTEFLRLWRDVHLLHQWYGPGLVWLYYLVSPAVVILCRQSHWLNMTMQRVLNHILRNVGG